MRFLSARISKRAQAVDCIKQDGEDAVSYTATYCTLLPSKKDDQEITN